MQLSQLGSQEIQEFIDRIRDTRLFTMQRKEAWLSCLAVILQTISVHV
jgi:hypothetical protein